MLSSVHRFYVYLIVRLGPGEMAESGKRLLKKPEHPSLILRTHIETTKDGGLLVIPVLGRQGLGDP